MISVEMLAEWRRQHPVSGNSSVSTL
jgi:hypothetical protein